MRPLFRVSFKRGSTLHENCSGLHYEKKIMVVRNNHDGTLDLYITK